MSVGTNSLSRYNYILKVAHLNFINKYIISYNNYNKNNIEEKQLGFRKNNEKSTTCIENIIGKKNGCR